MNNTWIKLHRNIIDWEWFHDKNCLMLLIYLNCRVNIVDKKWQGRTIERGSMVLSWETLSNRIKLSPKQCRTAMQKLEDSGEVTRIVTNKYQVVTLAKWEKMQHDTENRADKGNVKGQTKGMSEGRQRATTKERKESKEEKERREVLDIWLNYRKEIKKPIKSKSTIEALINKIELNGLEKSNAVIGTSIENGWQGLFWDKVQNKKNNTDPIKNLTF